MKLSYCSVLLFFSTMIVGQSSPNIILVMCDDLGWGDVGFNGNQVIQTPHLDRMAAKGIRFDRFYAAGAVCSPTRASCITGRNPYRMGIYTANAGHMKTEEITLPEILRTQGYTSGHFGKWHLGTLTAMIQDANRGRPRDYTHYSLPTANGYDRYFCTESKVPTWDPMIKPVEFDTEKGESLRYGWAAIEDQRRGKEIETYGTYYWEGPESMVLKNVEGDNSRVIMDRVLPFIKSAVHAHRPFFATVWFHTPHLPVVTGKKYREQYAEYTHEEQLYYGTISAMDEQMGRLWSMLEDLGVAEQTMIWFCSDNGPENGTPGTTGPFRERKRSLYEGGVRVPAFLVWPNGIDAGQSTAIPAVTSDYLPTILSFLGQSYPDPDRPLDGQDLTALLRGADAKRSKPIGFQNRDRISWVTEQYKLISTDRGKTFELYNLVQDPSETTNIAENHPQLVDQYRSALETWLESCRKSDEGADY